MLKCRSLASLTNAFLPPPLRLRRRLQMQSLTSCQCSVCCGCFRQHFTIVVRDKHIRDMVCPVCWEPDINDPEHLNSYFSTLDIQVAPRQAPASPSPARIGPPISVKPGREFFFSSFVTLCEIPPIASYLGYSV